jgi:hypothetical protein
MQLAGRSTGPSMGLAEVKAIDKVQRPLLQKDEESGAARALELEREVQHLHKTIDAQRDEMERLRIGASEQTQNAVNAANGEITQLRGTIDALRDELDKQRIGEGERLQNAVTAANSEIVQLRGAVDALRDELDKQRIGESERMQNAVSLLQDEIRQLKSMADALREGLDDKIRENNLALHAQDMKHAAEKEELRKTISALRDRLEAARG